MSAAAVGDSSHHHTNLPTNTVLSAKTGFFWYLLHMFGVVTGRVSVVWIYSLRTCALFCFLLAAFLPQMSAAQVTLSGTVFTDSGITPAGVGLTVRAVLGTSTPSLQSTTTDSSGNFTITGIATSTMGAWTGATAATQEGWNAIVYGNGRFVASGYWDVTGNVLMYSNDGVTWLSGNEPTTNSHYGLAYGNGKFVATASDGTNRIIYSEDGINWTAIAAPEQNSWVGLTFGNGRFVAVSTGGSNRVMYSDDGVSWTLASSSDQNGWESVTYGNGRFVAVGYPVANSNVKMYSSDGITWTAGNEANGNSYTDVTYGNGRFVAVAADGASRIAYSNDGISWTAVTAPELNRWEAIAYGNGRYVAVACGINAATCNATAGGNRVMRSNDGISWTLASSSDPSQWRGVAYGAGRFVAVAPIGTNRVMYVNDGFGINIPVTLWVDATTTVKATTYVSGLTATGTLSGIPLHHNTFISHNATTSATSSVNRLEDLTFYDTTDDGDILYEAPIVGTTTIRGSFRVATGTTLNNRAVEVQGDFIQAGDWRNNGGGLRLAGVNSTVTGTTTGPNTLGATMLSPSSDGTSWQRLSVLGNDDRWNGFAYGNGMYVAVGSGSGAERVMTSTDGVNWTARSVAGNDDAWQDIIYANGRFVAVSNNGDRVIHSTDGLTWATTTAAGNDDGWSAITYGAGLFVAVGTFGNNRVMTSPDGITWTGRTSILSDNDNWTSVIFANGIFVALGQGVGIDRIMTSTNGTAWTSRSTVDNWWQDIAYANGRFVAVSNFGSRAMTSSDGITWATTTPAGNNDEWSGVAYGNGVFTAVSSGNGDDRVMTSPDGIVWTTRPTLDNDDNWVAVDYINGRFFAGSGNLAPATDRFMISNPSQLTFASTSSTTDMTVEYGAVRAPESVTLDVSGNLTGAGELQNRGALLLSGTNKILSLSSSTTDLTTLGSTTVRGSYTALTNASTSNLTIDSGGTLTIVSTSTVVVGGDFTQNGSLNNNGVIAFAGTSSVATGTLTGVNDLGNVTMRPGSDGRGWEAQSAADNNDSWVGITYGNGRFVAVGTGPGTDRVMTSTDGLTWATTSAAGNNDDWQAITYGNGRFVAVGSGPGTDRVMTSTDGLTWATTSAAGNDDTWYAVTHANGRFVAVASSPGTDRVMTSTDGLTWATTSATGNDDSWWGVTYGNGRFVASGNSADNNLMTSTDGLTWATTSAAGNNDSWNAITFGNGRFVAVSSAGDRVMTSTDGLTWATTSAAGNNDVWLSISYANGRFVAVASSTVSGGLDVVMTSTDGLTWATTSAAGNNDFWSGITYGNGRFVAVGQSGDRVIASSPGQFTIGTTSSTTDLTLESGVVNVPTAVSLDIAGNVTNRGELRNNGALFLTGSNKNISMQATSSNIPTMGSTTIRGSYNFLTRASTTNLTVNLGGSMTVNTGARVGIERDLTQNGSLTNNGVLDFTGRSNRFLGNPSGANVLGNLNVRNAGDGSRWQSWAPAGNNDWWNAVTYGNGLFVAVGENFGTTVMTSPDGINWTVRSAAGNDDSWEGITYANGLFVAVGNAGTDRVMTSPDAINWTAQAVPESSPWESVTYGNGRFVAVASDAAGGSQIMTSVNGITWATTTAPGNNDDWQSVTYGNGVFVAVGGFIVGDYVMYSYDGLTWATTTAGGSLTSVTYGNGLFVATQGGVGGGGRVYTSPNGIEWTERTVPVDANLRTITYGDGIFVAVGISGSNKRVVSSSDGITWTAHPVPAFSQWFGITYGDGLFVAVAGQAGDRVMTSLPGTFTMTRPASTTDLTIERGTFLSTSSLTVSGTLTNSGTLVNTGTLQLTGTGQVVNPLASASTSIAALGNTIITGDVTFASGASTSNLTVAPGATLTAPAGTLSVGGDFTQNGTFRHRGLLSLEGSSSTISGTLTGRDLLGTVVNNAAGDGTEWEGRTATEAIAWSSIVYGNGLFVAVSVGGFQQVMTSLDGVTWTPRTQSADGSWQSVAFGNGLFVAVSAGGFDAVMTSPDGINWTTQSVPELNSWQSVTYGDGLFVAVSSDGLNQVMTSTDGITWIERAEAENNSTLRSVTYGNGRFVAVSSFGTHRVMTSPDGITWATSSATQANNWRSVTYGNGRFVAVSADGTHRVMTSSDGIIWATSSAAAASAWQSVTYGNGLFIAVANADTTRVMTSPDGITWTSQTAAQANQWNSITYGNGQFIAVAQSGTNRVMTSAGRTLFANSATTLSLENSPNRRLQLGTTTLTVLNNYTNNGTLNAGSSTVILAGVNQQIATGTLSGTSTFHNLTLSNTSEQGSSTQAVIFRRPVQTTGTFSMTPGTSAQFLASATSTFQNISLRGGATTTPVFLRSSTLGTQTFINVLGNQVQVGNVNVRDSRSVGTTNIVCTNCANLGNTTNWTFNALTVGGLALGNHSLGQVSNLFSGLDQVAGPLFAFSLAPSGESSIVRALTLEVSGRRNVTNESVIDVVLWRDSDNTRTLTAGDFFIATGTAVYTEQSGTITFNTTFTATSTRDYLVTAGTVNISPSQSFTLSLPTVAIEAGGASTTETILVSGSVLKIQHSRIGGNSGGGSIGEAAPAGAGVVGGGGSGAGVGGGAGAGGGDTGDNISPSPDFRAPSATGDIFSAWTAGGSAFISDGVRASSAAGAAQQSYSNFDFSIPSGNTISGISVKLDASGSTAAGTIAVSLSWDEGNTFTTTQVTPTLSGSDVVYTIGGPSNLWGRTWSPNNFTNPNFRLVVTAQPGANTVLLDAIAVSVYHVAGGGGAGGGAGGGGI